MITVIIFAVLGFVIAHKLENDSASRIGISIIGFLVGALIAFIITEITTGSHPEWKKARIIKEERLVAFEDAPQTEGSFFLGCGKCREKFYYRYRYRQEDGSTVFNRMLAKGKPVYETNKVEPKIVYIQNYYENKIEGILRFFTFGFYNPGKDSEIKIYVPPESIRNNFEIDNH